VEGYVCVAAVRGAGRVGWGWRVAHAQPVSFKSPRFLFISAAVQSLKNGVLVTTPVEIRDKVMWHPPMPDAEEAALLAQELVKVGVYLNKDSVLFFLKVVGDHRGIFMKVME
jgi:hypothetical protein